MFEECNKYIPKNAICIHNILNNKGFDTYFVGGALRDFYLKEYLGKDINIKDWDITTTARYEELEEFFSKLLRVNEEGKIVTKKGSTKLLIDGIETTGVTINNEVYEVTPMNYKDENNITFTKDIYEDLMTRDFTINSMAYSPKLGSITSFVNNAGKEVNCIEDLKKGIIKSTYDPNLLCKIERFSMIRAIVFANKLDFEIEENTLSAIKHNILDVNLLNKGKLSIAFSKIIMSESKAKLNYLVESGLFKALCLDFNDELGTNLIDIICEMKNELKEKSYYDRLKFIYDRFERQDLLLNLLSEFGVNKNILCRL